MTAALERLKAALSERETELQVQYSITRFRLIAAEWELHQIRKALRERKKPKRKRNTK